MSFLSHDVPMCPQRIDPREWEYHGGTGLGDIDEWSDRACGMAALRMILLARRIPAPCLTELLQLGSAQGALTGRGWLHAGIAALASELGLPGRAEAIASDDLPAAIKDGPLIASVTFQFPDDGRRGGHLVVLRGYEQGTADPLILFRDPSRWGQEQDRVALSRLARSYAGRCITFTPATQASPTPE
jgi:hypothetical protein